MAGNDSIYSGGILKWDVNSTDEMEWDSRGIIEAFKQNLVTLHQPSTIILISLYIPVFLTAVIGNITVLFVVIPNRRMWSVTNNFLLNLAIADLLVAFVCVPMTVAEKIYRLWIYGEALCKLVPYLQGVSVTASILTITSMSLDRCLAIRHPVKYRNIRTSKYARIIVVIIWIVSCLLAIPLLFVRSTSTLEIIEGEFLTYCLEDWTNHLHRQVYDVILLILIFFIPGVTLLVAYLLMGKKLWIPDRKLIAERTLPRRTRRKSHEREQSIRNLTQNRRRLAKLCIAIAVVFIICWTPYFIVNTYLDFRSDVNDLDLLSYSLLIGHIHCASNPVVYCFLHKTFRNYVFRCFTTKQRQKGFHEAPYMTLNKAIPKHRIIRESLESESSPQRESSSTSSSHGQREDRALNKEIVTNSIREKIFSRNNFTTINVDKYVRNLEDHR